MAKSSALAQPRQKGAAGFDHYYSEVFAERWPKLKEALMAEKPRVARLNQFAEPASQAALLPAMEPLSFAPGCYLSLSGTQDPRRDSQGLLSHYLMDPASALVAGLVDVDPESNVLDLCAAPGGKALVLCQRFAQHGSVSLNDRSPDRLRRLTQVLKDYVPKPLCDKIRLSRYDAMRWGLHRQNEYDAILLDAPCSSEQHVLRDQKALADWSYHRVRRLAAEQLGMVRSALKALRPGGLLVYATCSLTHEENDGVIGEALKREAGAASLLETTLPIGERTHFGWHILPDRHGFGPMFAARLLKTAAANEP